mmetsp:Transcript_15886/g.29027  ORF Transcript_15886/g.29027 Transcript_15886/m.29027 type:complete len:737 (-) Transcript_15886:52-2262(-)
MRRWGRRLASSGQQATPIDLDAVADSPVEDPVRSAATLALTASSATQSPASAGPSVPKPHGSLSGARRGVPINPRISMAFATKAAAGEKLFADPSVSAVSSSSPAETSTAQHERPGTLVWVRPFDLRIHDNPGLAHAARRSRPVYVVFPWSDEEDAQQGVWRVGGTAYAFWMHHALQSLDSSLQREYGLRILYRTGSSIGALLAQVAQECGVDEVVTSIAYDPAGKLSDEAAHAALDAVGVKLRKFQSFLLYNIEDIRVDMTSWRGHFGTLTPFHSACQSAGQPPKPVATPHSLHPGKRQLFTEGLSALGFARMPVREDGSTVDWGAPILEAWSICEEVALAMLHRFLAPGGGFSRYEKERHLADATALSRLSPYLRAGMLSCRRMYWAIMDAGGRQVSVTFWRRLIWRDLAYWQLHHFRDMQEKPIRTHYAGQLWRDGTRDGTLKAWRRGMTGFPLVDAGMRELWATGWMAQNARMAAAVLLCELLNINWVEGEIWFHHTLVDADPAINAMMWQNAGKGGLDQWNFTLHPVNSGKTQDPHGKYLRKWLPELANLPTRYLHAPWEASPDVLQKAGVAIGTGGGSSCSLYPARIITDIRAASQVSTSAIREQRARNLAWNDAGGYDLIVLPRGSTTAHDGQKFRIFTKKDWRLPSGNSHWSGDYEEADEGDSWSSPQGGQQQTWRRGGQHAQGYAPPRNQRRRVEHHQRGTAKSEEVGAAGSFQTVLDEYIQKASGA